MHRGKRRAVRYNAVAVELPGYDQSLHMIVQKEFGMKPMMLLTNCAVNIHKKQSIWKIVEYYLTRWKCDELHRYIKQCYNLKDIRVRSYISIRNVVALVLAVSYFAAGYLRQNIKLRLMVEQVFLVSNRFFGVPSFFNYAVADGIYNLLFPDKIASWGLSATGSDDFQLIFAFG